VALQSENVEVLSESIEISKERLRRAQSQLEFGQGNGLDVLNAEVDIKRDSVNLLNALLAVDNEKRNLNFAMSRTSTEDFSVLASTEIDASLNLEDLIASAKEDNIALQINRQTLSVNEMDLDIIEAERKPTLSAGASYDFNFSDNATGSFIDQSNSRGLSANVTVAWTLYDGSRDIRKQNTALGLTNLKLQADLVEQQLERDIINAWATYQNSIFILEVEESAVETNRENFTRTEEQVKFGRLTSLEFRQAQLNLLNAQTSVNNAKLNAKLAEIQLLALVGRLL
jgi:outer membrane protein TolC